MKSFTSFQELEALGAALAKKYTADTHRWNAGCFDIEGFITDGLRLPIVYERFAEDDPGKIGFLADGRTPLFILKNGRKEAVIFPRNTIVIERALLRTEESGRRRFTLAHEVAHYIMNKHVPLQAVACFHSEYDNEMSYSRKDLERLFSLNEVLTNRLGAAILMPEWLVEKALKKYNNGKPVQYYETGIFSQDTKLMVQKVADSLGVSFSAVINRLRELNKLECRPIMEYLEVLMPGGSSCS